MKNSVKSLAGSTVPVMALIVFAVLSGCSVTPASAGFQPFSPLPTIHAVGSPAATPTVTVYTARPKSFDVGEKPFQSLAAESISSISITINRDSQPPDRPDPFKLIIDSTLIQQTVNYFKGMSIVESSADSNQLMTVAPGTTTFNISIVNYDGTKLEFGLAGKFLSLGNTYAMSGIPISFDIFYEQLNCAELLDPASNRTAKLFSIDGWAYYAELAGSPGDRQYSRAGKLIRFNEKEAKTERVDELVSLLPFKARSDGSRIVFIGYQGSSGHELETQVLVSIKPDGSDRKILEPRFMHFSDPQWDNGKLYYVGWTQDSLYPKPLNRVNPDFTRHIKVMDIPGPLVDVVGGKVYCLSQDRKSLIKLPGGTVLSSFEAPIETFVTLNGGWDFIDQKGKQYYWVQ